MRRDSVRTIAALTLGLAISQAVAAAENETLSGYYETATVRARPLSSTVNSVTVLDRQAIAALDVATVGELLSFVEGLSSTSLGSRSGSTTAQVRGGDPNFTVVLVDGVPLNDSTDPFGGAVNLNALPTAHVERIEIVRGPVSSHYGSAGLAGVINVITRRGGGETSAGGSVAGGDASYGRVVGSLSGGREAAGYFVGLSAEREDERIAEDRFRQFGAQGSYDRKGEGNHGVRVSGRATTWEADDYADGSGGPVYGSGEPRRSEHDEASVSFEWRGGASPREQRVWVTGYWHQMDRESPAIDPVVPPSTDATRFLDARLGWNISFATASSGHLTLGLEARSESGRNESTLFLPPELGGPLPADYDLSRATGAARVDWSASKGTLAFELGARVDVPEGGGEQLSPRAGISWGFGGRHRLRSSAGRSFKLPSFFALGSPAALGGNPDLEPEISTGADAGIDLVSREGTVRVALTVFAMRFRDLIDFDFDTFQIVNRDEVETFGSELAIDWAPSEELAVRLNVTHQDAENVGSSVPLRRRPSWVGGVRLAWRPTQRWLWDVDLHGTSSQIDEQIPVPSRDTVDGALLAGTALRFGFAPNWKAGLRVDNLLDEEYETLIGFPGPGRAYRVSVSYGGAPD